MSWLLLTVSILLEVAGTTTLKLSEGFTRLWPIFGMVCFYSLSFWGISLALRHIELSVAYAIWSGVGTALTALIGIWWFKEPATALKLASIALVLAGVVGLHLAAQAR